MDPHAYRVEHNPEHRPVSDHCTGTLQVDLSETDTTTVRHHGLVLRSGRTHEDYLNARELARDLTRNPRSFIPVPKPNLLTSKAYGTPPNIPVNHPTVPNLSLHRPSGIDENLTVFENSPFANEIRTHMVDSAYHGSLEIEHPGPSTGDQQIRGLDMDPHSVYRENGNSEQYTSNMPKGDMFSKDRLNSQNNHATDSCRAQTDQKTVGKKMNKFCYECGSAFPSAAAKFCPECGIKRLVA
ncbi:unnamed protein product [Echinostoma caproni]|uniref:Zinc_ribbon_2 domain-containing protein n=1 Tax=Echinostoma caproni TaxID=27848 RepID=A0A183AYZ4_9TREM|nr:unnamed protein product [Echinostoma caproni]